ncbi:voltage-dependent calcium channel subunit alpha-2/delta-3-like isoform X3 [Rhodnius prolixus]|uniref:voltage-dependent calcium channel subunit alpha-2/delta-3-like isoform X3 n=1 Tax=Rhodnius prolixus TaxID=13249 RepID=UPI003D18DB87
MSFLSGLVQNVEKWASRLGQELWDLGLSVTKASEIRASYKKFNARVLPTDGEAILKTIVTNVNKLLTRKMDSVTCLIHVAEDLAEEFAEDNSTFHYYSSKFSPRNGVVDEEHENLNISFYLDMNLGSDSQFYDLLVNSTFSSVHVPTDVLDRGSDVKRAILWSNYLDSVFQNNMLSDPTMSWQHFGSSTGFLRHFPAVHWNMGIDMFDCRTRPWYIEAATCSKEIVILVDNSGSMWGMRNTIARLTVSTILDTFSNNDFINIFSFNKTVKELVPCINSDILVQATPENIQVFKEAVFKLCPDDKADFPLAFEAAFNLLAKARKNRTCPENICNQALMLVTDSIPENITYIFEKFNWFNNRTHIPVRVFTYLIGREVINVKEIEFAACMNRGGMVHIKSLEEVRSQVMKYISVIARPLVMQAIEHPLSWTHTFVDIMGNLKEEDSKEINFITSVSGPAFDRRSKINNTLTNLTNPTDLLGVVATDVPISLIKSLTLPYKIGANGYAFVLTNNGYLLFHPDLRAVYKGNLKENYNSVDLTEVELLDDEVQEPRSPSADILKLRKMMVSGVEGKLLGLKIKFHYGNMRRIGVETRNYYFAPLNSTPFTMGLVLPQPYGNHWIKAGDEIKKSKQMGIPIGSYFKGNWRIHPDWVYCDYHWKYEHNFNTTEDKLLHFLKRIDSPDWQWKEQFQTDYHSRNFEKCAWPNIPPDEYFCDKELMQLLVFDAKITDNSYKTSKWAAKDRKEKELVERFGASVRFVATQSGLTRWHHIPDEANVTRSFGEDNQNALEEMWYKSAVLHHQLDPDAFVFSVPFDAGSQKHIKVTASHAIFPRDGGNEAPGSVVGFQIDHAAFYRRFSEITSKHNCPTCPSCASDELDCYVIDGHGYIVLSEVRNDTGKFFGEVEGAIMEAMVSKNIFRQVLMFDYQGVCPEDVKGPNSVSRLANPFLAVLHMAHWIFKAILGILIENNIMSFVKGDSEEDYYEDNFIRGTGVIGSSFGKDFVDVKPTFRPVSDVPEVKYDACDEMGLFYLLQHWSKEGYYSASAANCSRPFSVKRVQHTNLLLIVVNALYQSCYRPMSARMKKVEYNDSMAHMAPCHKLNLNSLPRRPLTGCFNTHHLVIAAVIRERYLHTATNYFVTSLALADCLVGLVVMPFSAIYEVFQHNWFFGLNWCDIWRSLDVLFSTASILNLCVISLDRYWAITDPFAYPHRMSDRRACMLIAAIWICSMAISFPAILWWRAVRTETVPGNKCPFTDNLGYLIFSSTISFYVPLFVMVFTYYRIYRAAVEQTKSLKLGSKQVMMTRGEIELTLRIHRGRGMVYESPSLSDEVAELDRPLQNGAPRQTVANLLHPRHLGKNFSLARKLSKFAKEKKAAKTLGIVMGVFIICWLPFFVVNLLSGFCVYCIYQEELVSAIVTWLGWINSGMNPVIYVCWSKDFRRAFARILCFCESRKLDQRHRGPLRAPYLGAHNMVLAPASVTYSTVCQHEMYSI